MNKEPPIVFAGYKAEDWNEWMKLCPDDMCETWEEWNQGAEKVLAKAARDRVIAHVSTIRPQPFQIWARKNEKPINGYSRSEYAGELIKETVFAKHELPEKLPSRAEVNRLLRKAVQANPEISSVDIWDPYLRRPDASICPIFREDEKGDPEQFGSGVLMRIANYFFLISAAHVLDEFKEHLILIPGKSHLIPLTGPYSATRLPDTGLRKDDHDDLGYLQFKSGLEHQLNGNLVFLDERDCNPMDITKEKDAYTIIGYPSERSESVSGTVQTGITRISGEGVQDHRYAKLDLKPNSHLLIQYRRKKATSSFSMLQAKAIDFGGMSGGGVFAWSKELPSPSALAQPSLVGIVTGYSTFHNVFISTRIHRVLSAMYKEFPDLPFCYR